MNSQASLTEGMQQGAPPLRAFAIQYLSVVLIILTFTLGVFSSHKISRDRAKIALVQQQTQPVRTEPTLVSVGDVTFSNLFGAGSAELEPAVLESLVAVLRAHDLKAIFTVAGADSVSEGNTSLGLALARGSTLYRVLQAESVPTEAFEILSSEDPSLNFQAKVHFQRSAP